MAIPVVLSFYITHQVTTPLDQAAPVFHSHRPHRFHRLPDPWNRSKAPRDPPRRAPGVWRRTGRQTTRQVRCLPFLPPKPREDGGRTRRKPPFGSVPENAERSGLRVSRTRRTDVRRVRSTNPNSQRVSCEKRGQTVGGLEKNKRRRYRKFNPRTPKHSATLHRHSKVCKQCDVHDASLE